MNVPLYAISVNVLVIISYLLTPVTTIAPPMMYIDDCIEATVRFLKADPNKLLRSTYNLAGISFTPKELTEAIKKLIPEANVTYEPDFR